MDSRIDDGVAACIKYKTLHPLVNLLHERQQGRAVVVPDPLQV